MHIHFVNTYACGWIITVDQVPIARGHDLLGKITRILVVKTSLRLAHNLGYLPTKPSYEDVLHDRRRTLCWCCCLGGCQFTRETMTVSAILSGIGLPRNREIMVDTRPSIHFYRSGLTCPFFVLLPFPEGGRRTRASRERTNLVHKGALPQAGKEKSRWVSVGIKYSPFSIVGCTEGDQL